MKFPLLVRFIAPIQMIGGVIVLLALVIITVQEGLPVDKLWAGLLFYFAAGYALYSVVSSLMWVLAYRDSFTLIAGNIFNNIIAVTLLVLGFIKAEQTEQKILLAIIAVCFVLPVFLYAALLIFKPMRDYTRSVRRHLVSPVALCVYVIATFSPLAYPFYQKHFKYPVEIVVDTAQIFSDGYLSGHEPSKVYDEDWYSWWIPQSRNGIKSHLNFNFEKEIQLCRITVIPGAQWRGSGDDDDINLFDDYSRPKKIEVAFSNGGTLQFDLKNSSESQDFTFKPITTGSVTVTVLETFKGKKKDDLCITEISFGKPGKYFSKTGFDLFGGSDSGVDE